MGAIRELHRDQRAANAAFDSRLLLEGTAAGPARVAALSVQAAAVAASPVYASGSAATIASAAAVPFGMLPRTAQLLQPIDCGALDAMRLMARACLGIYSMQNL